MTEATRTLRFRSEAVAHAGARGPGALLLTQPAAHTVLTLVFAALGAALVAFLCCASYTRKTSVPGMLLPTRGLLRIVPAQGGLVLQARVHEGQAVQAGDPLFVLSTEHADPDQDGATRTISTLLQARRDSLREDAAQARAQSRERLAAARSRGADLATELHRIDDEIALQARRMQLAQATLQRFGDLQKDGFVSPMQVQDKQAALLEQQQKAAELQRERAAAARDLAAAQADGRDLEIQAARDAQAGARGVDGAEQALAEEQRRREVIVRAPEAGVVAAIAARPGQAVGNGSALATLVPDGSQMEAELYAPTRSIGFLRPGLPVSLRYQAFAYQKFGQSHGVVSEVSRTALRPEDLDLPGVAPAGEPLYRVRVRLDRQSVLAYGTEQPLRAGELLDASIALDRRRLWEWVLEPLTALSGHL